MCKESQNHPKVTHSLRRKDGSLKKNQFRQQIIKSFEAKGIWCTDSRRPAKSLWPLVFILVHRINKLTGTKQVSIWEEANSQARAIARLDGISWGLNDKNEASYVLPDL